MFKKILIANRGEIAVRIMRACREMNIATVAVYSDADREALHVRMADEAYHIGAAPSAESYLRQEKIIETAKRSGAEAIHPGYGFLSENAGFVRRVRSEGLTFIGPPPEAIEAMGGKISARKIAVEAGVPVVPGTTEPLKDFEEAKAVAAEIGFPVMLKASAGGGGKGMRLVASEKDLKNALEAAQSEALASFGDDAVYIEKAIVRPRHIEIQIFPTRTAITFISANANVRSSAVIRRSSKNVRRRSTMPLCAKKWANAPSAWQRPSDMREPERSNFSSRTSTGRSIFSK
jgi:acetyl-CoA carboxylase biotin carboxylase subunit